MHGSRECPFCGDSIDISTLSKFQDYVDHLEAHASDTDDQETLPTSAEDAASFTDFESEGHRTGMYRADLYGRSGDDVEWP